MANQNFTLGRVHELLNYDKQSGIFTWKKSLRGPIKAGDQAGYKRSKLMVLAFGLTGLHGFMYTAHGQQISLTISTATHLTTDSAISVTCPQM